MDTSEAVTHLGLCAGYGGIELGLQRAIPDLRTVALCEIEAFAIANLVAKMEAGLMDPAPIWPNLKTFPWEAFRDRVDILTGGYPCQPFSAAGQRKGKQDPRHLWPWIADGIRLLKPRCCFFENVEGHISLGLSDVIEDLAGMGYRTTWGIFSASECGAPHQRKRVFILAECSSQRGAARLSRQIAGQEGISGVVDYGGDESMGNTKRQRVEGAHDNACAPRGLQSNAYQSSSAWPSRPGEQQYGWEPPRVVGDTKSQQDRGIQQSGVQTDAASAGEQLGDTRSEESRRISSGCGREKVAKVRESDIWQAEPSLGGNTDGTTYRMDDAELYVSCDNRTDELRLLGNGVVPATAERAFRVLIKELL